MGCTQISVSTTFKAKDAEREMTVCEPGGANDASLSAVEQCCCYFSGALSFAGRSCGSGKMSQLGRAFFSSNRA